MKLPNFNSLLLMVFIGILLLCFPHAGYGIAFTSQENFSVTTVNPADQEIVETDMAGGYKVIQQSLFALLPPEVDIDALDFMNPTTVVFSLQEDATLPGVGKVADEDLLLYNGSVLSMLLDGSANGLPAETDIDAVDVLSLSPLTCSFSLREGASLPGIGQVSRNDAIRFVQGVGFTGKDFNGITAGIPLETNVDAFSRTDGSNYVISLSVAATVSSSNYGKADLIQYNIGGGTFSSYFIASNYGIPPEVNIQDVDAIPYHVPVELSEFYVTYE